MSRIPAAYRACRLALAFIVFAAAAASAQDTAPLPLDPAIRTGTLPNGLTYFIRRNEHPEHRALLRLVVKAGSIDEAEDQRGLAHMLEHMNFNGGAHFKPGELVKYLESIGARFGPHVNAYTSFDETVYMLDVPADKDGVLARGFEALGDFAGGATLSREEIDKERGVVIEEWRGRLGAGERMQKPQMDVLYGTDSLYTNRLPIGTPEILRTFTPQRLRDFYTANYRPERMAVIAVGDVDPAQIEQLIRTNFSSLRRGTTTHRVAQIPTHAETRYATVTDPEATSSSVSISFKRPIEHLRSAADYRREVLASLVSGMMNARFSEIARQPDAPFLGAGAGGGAMGLTMDSFDVSARVKDGGIEGGLTAVSTELARIRQHGFLESELDRAKRGILAQYERAYNERDKAESGGYAGELVRYYLSGEAAPGIARELELLRQFLPTYTIAEANGLVGTLMPEGNRVVIATAPEKAGLTPVSQTALREALRAGLSAETTAWKDEMSGKELLAKAPTPGTVTARREIPEIGVTVLTLSNGVDVWLKPTDFRNDQIIFSAYSKGGLSLADESQFWNASLATAYVNAAGVGGFSPIELGKLLAGKIANASAGISTYSQGVSGSATPKDLETALQLAYLDFTAPNKDLAAFQRLEQRLEASIANQGQSPGQVFGERVRAINTNDHYTAKTLKADDLAKLDPEQMLAFYQQRFANAANFTFFFVGAFTVEDVTPLVAKYIGGLPSTGKADAQIGGMRLTFPSAVVRDTVNKGREPRSQTIVSFFADASRDEFETHRLRAATSVLENHLRDILREELGGTYSVSVGYSDMSPVPGYGSVSIQFGFAPENQDKLMTAVMKEVDRLRAEGPTAADVNAVKEAEKNDLRNSYKQNNYWLNSLQTAHMLGRDPTRIALRVERADSLTPENVHEAFKKYFPADRYTVVTLMPETTATAASR